MNIKKFYRYEIDKYRSSDVAFSNRLSTKLACRTFYLHKETPKGYWISSFKPGSMLESKDKWISKTSRKRFAYPTKEEALENYIFRTQCRVGYLEKNLEHAKNGLENAKWELKRVINKDLI